MPKICKIMQKYMPHTGAASIIANIILHYFKGMAATAFVLMGEKLPAVYWLSPSEAIIAALSVQYFFSGRTSFSPAFRQASLKVERR